MRKPRIELFDFKNKENQEAFLEETTASNSLSASFTVERSYIRNANIFLTNLNSTFHTCFKKIRITPGIRAKYGQKSLQELLKLKMDQKQWSLNCEDLNEKTKVLKKLEETEKLLSENFASKTAEIIRDHVNEIIGRKLLSYWFLEN